MEEARK